MRRLVDELLTAELDQRSNGDHAAAELRGQASLPTAPEPPAVASMVATQPAPRVCVVCAEREPAPGRRVCHGCRARARREQQRQAKAETEEPAPARARFLPKPGGPDQLRSRGELDEQEQRRQLLRELRANGVEHADRNGQQFVLIRLPDSPLPLRSEAPPPVRRHRPGATVTGLA